MKIIDLLNKIANGEEDLPKRIEYRNKKFVYDKCNQLYIVENYNEYNDLLMELSNHKGTDLLYEVEILEEEKKIPEKLNLDTDELRGNETPRAIDYLIESKINQVIDYLKSKGE